VIFYFAFFPPTLQKRIIYSTPLLIFPFLILLCKSLFGWFFERKIRRNTVKLKELQTEKKKILEKVMDKETYKVAVEILNRFSEGPKQPTDMHSIVPRSPSVQAPAGPPNTVRGPPNTPAKRNENPAPFQTPAFGQPPPPGIVSISQTPLTSHLPPGAQRALMQVTPYPIVSQNQKSVVEKLVDYLIGDGPNSRYAMICKECFEHNGMVSEEEYDYAAFRCAFCKTLNAAKKLRPIGPRISSHLPNISHYQLPAQQFALRSSKAGSESSTSSDSDDTPSGVAPSTEHPFKKPPELPVEHPSNGSVEDIVQPEAKSSEAVPEQQINEVPIETLSDKPAQQKKDE